MASGKARRKYPKDWGDGIEEGLKAGRRVYVMYNDTSHAVRQILGYAKQDLDLIPPGTFGKGSRIVSRFNITTDGASHYHRDDFGGSPSISNKSGPKGRFRPQVSK